MRSPPDSSLRRTWSYCPKAWGLAPIPQPSRTGDHDHHASKGGAEIHTINKGAYLSTAASHQLQAIDLAIEQLVELAGGGNCLRVPPGTAHLGLAIIDAVFAADSHPHTAMEPLLRRYSDAVPGFGWSHHFSNEMPWHGTSALLRFLTSVSAHERYQLLGDQTAPTTNRKQADVVLDIAGTLLAHGIDDIDDLARGVRVNHQVEFDLLALAGVDQSMWHRLLNRSGDNCIKPDTAMVEWVRTILFDETITAQDAGRLIETATQNIQDRGATYSFRAVDHLIRLDASELGGL